MLQPDMFKLGLLPLHEITHCSKYIYGKNYKQVIKNDCRTMTQVWKSQTCRLLFFIFVVFKSNSESYLEDRGESWSWQVWHEFMGQQFTNLHVNTCWYTNAAVHARAYTISQALNHHSYECSLTYCMLSHKSYTVPKASWLRYAYLIFSQAVQQ